MKKVLLILVCQLLLVFAANVGFAQSVDGDYAKTANVLTLKLEQGQEQEAMLMLDNNMQKAMAGKLVETWQGLGASYGKFQKSGDSIETEIAGFKVVETALLFEKRIIVQRVAFARDGLIAGLYFR